jgi:hypothetical protein
LDSKLLPGIQNYSVEEVKRSQNTTPDGGKSTPMTPMMNIVILGQNNVNKIDLPPTPELKEGSMLDTEPVYRTKTNSNIRKSARKKLDPFTPNAKKNVI